MVRNYKRKTTRGSASDDTINSAIETAETSGKSIRQVAREFGLCHQTLRRHVKNKFEDMPIKTGHSKTRMIFTDEQESELTQYIIAASNVYFGLCPADVRKLAYQCGVAAGIKMPTSWTRDQMAGRDWFTSFMKRNPTLSIRTAEATSLSRATSFNVANVSAFFDKLEDVKVRYGLTNKDMWNLDETGVTTVQKPRQVVASKGAKQVGAMTSAERGQLVTMCAAVSATGNFTPPMLIFPRVRFHDHFIARSPPGTIGVSHPSGWMTEASFQVFIEHFIQYVRPSKEQPVLLLLDNHESHLSINVLNRCKESGIVMFSFPPHCSHKLQPLDLSVYGPLKRHLSNTQNNWMRDNPGKTMTIHDISSLLEVAFPLAFTPKNIISGFAVSGISPFNRDIFTELDFAPSYVTDRPYNENTTSGVSVTTAEETSMPVEENSSNLQQTNVSKDSSMNKDDSFAIPSTSKDSIASIDDLPQESMSSGASSNKLNPFLVSPLPKAGERKQSSRGRKRRKTAILTDTPEKNALEDEKRSSKNKKSTKSKEDSKKPKRRLNYSNKTAELDSTDEEEYFCLICVEPYSNSRPKESWIQCSTCRKWSHANCLSNPKVTTYVCHNCESDDEII